MIPKKVYVAGPMRGYPLFNFPAFDQAAAALRRIGMEVRSPAEHDRETGFDPTLESLDGFDMQAAMRWDLESVLWADMVVLLPGWEKSSGCRVELTVAKAVGTRVAEWHLAYDELDRRIAPDTPPPASESILDQAKALVSGDRQSVYGHPIHDFTRTAGMWQAILGAEVTAEQVALCMIAVKMSRLVNTPSHRDSVVDIAGYAQTLHLVQQAREEAAS